MNEIKEDLTVFLPCMTMRDTARFEVAAFMVGEPRMEECKGETWSCHVRIISSCDSQCHDHDAAARGAQV